MKQSGDRIRGARLAVLGGGVVFVLAGCGNGQNTLQPKSPQAGSIATLWWIMLGVSTFGLAVIVGMLVVSWFKRGGVGRERPATITVLVLGIATPILVIAALFSYSDIFLIRGTSAPPPTSLVAKRALDITVIGHQFWWEVHYPKGKVVTANEIHIPVRTPVVVSVTSRDVIHSFWVPELNRKMDLEPGRTNQVEIYASKVGKYRGQCAEFCGLQHAHMAFYVFADPPPVFARWLKREAKPATRTLPLFQSTCSNCHAIQGTPANAHVGPDLTHVGSRTTIAAGTLTNTLANMEQWIAHPQEVKPGNQMPDLKLTGAQVHELAAYLESLK
ncbi:MAG TPA: cytochrome c oxidase subunit II [Gaiellaceae bacterium]|nr:cytochrome c oxidase subunit II [Gaiellaceae bacterium]